MTAVVIRPGNSSDIEPAISVWRAANAERRNGRPVSPEHEKRVQGFLQKPDTFLVVAEADGKVVGMAVGMQGRTQDGAGPPIEGLCHVSMIFVAPQYWGTGIGGKLVDATLDEARSREYGRVQLWTQNDNPRAQRLYEGRGFTHTGRQKRDHDLGELIMHYTRPL